MVRIRRNCTDTAVFRQELKNLTERFQARGYTNKLILAAVTTYVPEPIQPITRLPHYLPLSRTFLAGWPRSHNMASFDDNRDTLAAELFSMKPPATRTIDRTPSKEGLRQKFIKLERLRKQELARWSHNMASFDDNRDTLAAELFSMKPPATRTIDRTPSKEGLRQKFIKLERLRKQELARWWDITTLKRYLELKQVPRGLRFHSKKSPLTSLSPFNRSRGSPITYLCHAPSWPAGPGMSHSRGPSV
ncbi:hypothetical protein NDU88_007199 [Pleurodeles waltl]|uniref:Uncharacterized protein n=1 Tax=Pleurodeles waltl TaxID=8319 RepID=A0AAV7UPF4_PLEWA|nr:hypothetical protein NDU88_007199 [Pleurodeles waltl]